MMKRIFQTRGWQFLHDADGNLLHEEEDDLLWDAENRFVAGEDYMQLGILGQGRQGTGYRRLGAVVAAETVHEDLDHDNFFT